MLSLQGAPFPVTYRELWLPEAINGTNMPSSSRGNALTITGGAKRTTADGVRFIRGANSEVSLGVIHNSQAQLWISLRFKLDQTFAAGATASMRLFGKYIDADNFLELYLWNTDGRLYFKHRSATVTLFDMGPAQASWTAGTWYHIIASISSTAGARLIVNNGAATTNADVTAAPAGGSFVIGDQSVAGAIGISGVITDIIMGTDNLTANEESDLYKGIPPLDAAHIYTCDEGRGTTANDRGSGANNGTLGAAASWAFGQVIEAVLSDDGINDNCAVTGSALGEMAGAWTFFWVAKLKSTYATINRTNGLYAAEFGVDANNFVILRGFSTGTSLNWLLRSNGVATSINQDVPVIAIDSYGIAIATNSAAGLARAYWNGGPVTAETQLDGAFSPGAVEYWLNRGASFTSANGWDPSKTLLAGLIDGALTAKQVLTFSRWIRDIKNLPISI